MKKILVSVLSVSLLAICGQAFASGQLQRAGNPRSIKPIRVAPVDRFGRISGPWVSYGEGAHSSAPTQVAFDLAEFDPSTGLPSDTVYNPQYGTTDRFYFGDTYSNPYAVNDMTVAPGTEGKLATFVELAWVNSTPNENNVLVVVTGDTFGAGTLPAIDQLYSGVAYDFGPLEAGFWVSSVDLASRGLSHQMPMDGSGAYSLRIQQDGQGTLATLAQPALWGTKNRNGGTNPSVNGEFQWDDDNPTDGVLSLEEYYSYDYSADLGIADPLGAMIGFFVEPGSQGRNIAPSSFTIFRGSLVSGGLAELLNSDDQYLVVRNGPIAFPTEAPITVIFDATDTGSTRTGLSFKIENKVSINGLTQIVDLFNYTTNSYDTTAVDTRPAPTTDTVVTITGTGTIGRFFNGSNGMRARLRVRPAGPLFTNNWRSSTDQVQWTVTP